MGNRGILVRFHVTVEVAEMDGDRMGETFQVGPFRVTPSEWGDREVPWTVVDEVDQAGNPTKQHTEWGTAEEFVEKFMEQLNNMRSVVAGTNGSEPKKSKKKLSSVPKKKD